MTSRTGSVDRWTPSFGAWPDAGGTSFRVWAPSAREVRVALERPGGTLEHALSRTDDGIFEGWVADVHAGVRYRYRLDGGPALPDPASRCQPDGVHGSSEVVDAGAYRWSDEAWPGIEIERAVVYELHVGAFSPEGTFDGVAARLPYLRDLGVTVVELMPVADFAGRRNWGYDGVCLFAPARCYGRPDDLRRLVDTAHGLGLAVLLDVVYNHLGPDGAYLWQVSPEFFSHRHESPWGQGVNLDGPGSQVVRHWLVDNALHWIHEYHLDGLRLDATHALADDSPTHLIAELAARVHRGTERSVVVVAEDDRNLAVMVRQPEEGGWGLDAVWADDFHHQVRVLLAGDQDGYFGDFEGTSEDLAATIRRGWFYCGQHSAYRRGARGTDPTGIPPHRFVVCLQNHDQVGNRAFGERLHHQIDPAAWRAATALLLTAPETPLLFMGQEWAASTPFRYFTDHNEELGRLVTEGRRREFGRFEAFADPDVRDRIPDPQAEATFEASRLAWDELGSDAHLATWRLVRALLALRRDDPVFRPGTPFEVTAVGADSVVLHYGPPAGPGLTVAVRLRGAGSVQIPGPAAAECEPRCVLSTEDPQFASGPRPPVIDLADGDLIVHFGGPAALLLRWP